MKRWIPILAVGLLLLGGIARGAQGDPAKLWLKVHRLLGRGCAMGGMDGKHVCKAKGVALWEMGKPIEVVAIEACRELGEVKLRLLCVEMIADHWGPSRLDEPWERCHRDNTGIGAIRACLHRELFEKPWPAEGSGDRGG